MNSPYFLSQLPTEPSVMLSPKEGSTIHSTLNARLPISETILLDKANISYFLIEK
jgi:hypothetical protein